MNTKDNQRSRLTRMLLKNAYMRLMHEKPAAKISVKEICEGAEVNRSTFYLHFNEPNDILIELEDEMIAQVIESLGTIGALQEPSDDVQVYLLSFLRYIQRNDDLFRTFLLENSDPHFRMKFHDMAIAFMENSFAVDLPSNFKHNAFRFVVSGSIDLLTSWIRSNYAMSEVTLSKVLYTLCEGSLRSVTEMYYKK